MIRRVPQALVPAVLLPVLGALLLALACDRTAPSPTREATSAPTRTSQITRTAAPADTREGAGDRVAVVEKVAIPRELSDVLREFGRLRRYPSARAALAGVEREEAAFAMLRVGPAAEAPSGSVALLRRPLALFVPFTFPVESIPFEAALGLVGSTVLDWSVVGGPSLPIQLLRPDDVDDADELAGAVAGQPGLLGLAPWDGPHLGVKALRIDGLASDEAGYPFLERWVAVGRTPDGLVEAAAEAAAEPGRDYVTLAAVGDIMLGRSVAEDMAVEGWDYPFAEVEELLDADIVFGNLECVLTERGEPAPKGFTFQTPPAAVQGLVDAGFTVLSLANNHSMDYGAVGLEDTLAALDDAGILHAGAGMEAETARQPAVVEQDGLRIAFIAYGAFFEEASFGRAEQEAGEDTPGIAWGDPETVAADVALAREIADVVVVSLHSGLEYSDELSTTQQEVARAAIDAGADLVLGHGPHVLQGIEYYGEGVIAYSLGNFVFDFDEQDRAVPGMPSAFSGVLVVALDAGGVRGLEFRPAIIERNRPAPARGETADRVYDRLYALTNALAGVPSP